jgi:hypothetical protein
LCWRIMAWVSSSLSVPLQAAPDRLARLRRSCRWSVAALPRRPELPPTARAPACPRGGPARPAADPLRLSTLLARLRNVMPQGITAHGCDLPGTVLHRRNHGKRMG